MKKSTKALRTGAKAYGYLAPTLVLLVVFLVIPIVMVVSYSFYNNAVVVKDNYLVGFQNYAQILTDSEFWGAVKHTVIFVVVSVVAHILLGMGFALMLNSHYFKTRTKTVFRVFYILPWIFTASVIALLWRLILQPGGIADFMFSWLPAVDKSFSWLGETGIALAVVVFVNIWCGYPFYMISILAGLQGISGDLYESAALDGATGWKSFIHITIPQLSPILISIAMLDIIWTIQSFNVIWMLTGGGPLNVTETLSIYIYKLAFNSSQYGLASTVATIVLIVCVILAIFYVRLQRRAND
ncbi:MAG: sugar ABC transporter permease [Lachnospiraceae bacterium]|nr:sugar ABC transporter permease [Lachnospiraceae bacterium]